MLDRSSTRSAGYQHIIVEISCSPETLAECSDAQGVFGGINLISYKEELLDLQEQLLKEFWRIVDTQLTVRQAQVLHLSAEGKTQIEIAKILGVNQSSITKSINGNSDYRSKKKRLYGGTKKKVQKLASTDPVIQQIFKRMKELQEEYF